jgi:hypothetical protein
MRTITTALALRLLLPVVALLLAACWAAASRSTGSATSHGPRNC